MTEHLFQLRKDGKVVGYLQFRGTTPRATTSERPPKSIEGLVWYSADLQTMSFRDSDIEWDTAHPFICNDKNGKKVFGGNKVDSIGNRCLVMWHKVFLQWCLWHIEGDYYFGAVSKQDIELIEEQE